MAPETGGESVRLLTGRGLAFLLIPARTYCTFTPDVTLRSWPSGKATLQRKILKFKGKIKKEYLKDIQIIYHAFR